MSSPVYLGAKKVSGADGTLRITAEVVNVCDLIGGSDGSHTCDGISHDG